MKKLILAICCVASLQLSQAQTATDFNVNDCNGNLVNLFSELNSGKVIVLDWVMPCGACLGPTLTAYNIVQSYQSTNPGKVFFYLMDDFGNTACSALDGWANSNGVGPNRTTISSVDAKQTPYGGVGMPKIVIVGGGNHDVFYNQDGAAAGNVTDIQNAINQALVVSGIEHINQADFNLAVTNLSSQHLLINYSINQNTDVQMSILNSLGQQIQSLTEGNQVSGKHQSDVYFDKNLSGIYFLKITAGERSGMLKFLVAN